MSLFALALGAGISVQPAPDPVDADVRCFLVYSYYTAAAHRAKNELRASEMAMMMMYFFGRIDGGDPHYDLAAATDRLRVELQRPGVLEAEVKRCSDIVEERHAYLMKYAKANLDALTTTK